MPNTKSAKKRHRQDIQRRERNRATKASLKTQVRKVLQSLKDGDAGKAQEEFKLVAKKFDRAAAHRVIHANRAARTKSRLSQQIKAAKAK